MADKGNNQQRMGGNRAENPGNNQLGKQFGHNTEKDAAKSNIKPQTRNEPGAPKTTGPEKKELREDFQKRD